MDNKYRLQLLNHGEIFPTREDAMEYITDNYRGKALWGEPALFFYGSAKEPSVIVAVGASKNASSPRLCIIDQTELKELIANAQEGTDDNTKNIEDYGKKILNIIESVGLNLDENKKENQITYEPNKKDALISDAKSIAEAVSIISKYAQEYANDNALSVKDTKTLKLKTEQGEDGITLSGRVLLSKSGDDDDAAFNDNIIGTMSDGLYAACNIEFDEDKKELIFTKSGYKDDKFVADAFKKVITIGKHTEYKGDNEGHNVAVVVDGEKGAISADVKLAEDDDNLLENHSGQLYAPAKAKNIKYKGTNVADKLTELDKNLNAVTEQVDDIKPFEIEGGETDTMTVVAKKDKDGDYTITGDVRLGSNKSIVVNDGGLDVDMDITINNSKNQLTLRVGQKTKKITLPGVSIFESAEYDRENKVMIIKFKDGNSISIPVAELFPADAYGLKYGETNVGATLDKVVEDLINEINNRTNQAIEIIKDLENEVEKREHADEDIKHLIEDMKQELDLTLDLTKVKDELAEFKTTYDDFKEEWNKLEPQITKAIADAEAVAGRVNELEKNLGLTNQNLDTLTARVTAVEATDSTLTNNVNELTKNLTATNVEVNALKDRVLTAEGNINTNNSKIADNSSAIAREAALARQNESDIKNALENEVARSTGKDDELEKLINTNKTDVATAKTDIASLQSGLASEIIRATGVESGLTDLINDTKATVAENKTNIATNLQKLNDEFARATAKESEIEGKVSDEANRAKRAEELLQAAVTTNASGITENKTAIDKTNNTVSTLRSDLDAEKSRAEARENAIDTKVDTLAEKSEKASENALTQANLYTDGQVSNLKQTAADDATAKANKALDEAKAYSDLEASRAQTKEAAIDEDIKGLKDKDKELADIVATKVGEVKVEKNSQSDLQYTLYVDGVPAGEINIPKDQFLDDVRYDMGTKKLVFTWKIGAEHAETTVDVSDFLKTYSAGSGLNLDGDVFSVKLTGANESYLQVTADGIQLVGINSMFDTKADKTDVYTKGEVNNAIEVEAIERRRVESDLQSTNGNVTELTKRVTVNEGKLGVIQGNEAQEGSVQWAVKTAKDYADGLNNDEVARAKDAEKAAEANANKYTDELGKRVAANEDVIAKLDGNEAVVGSVANAVKKANEWTNQQIDIVNTGLNLKANKEEVYTKEQIDAKGYLVSADIQDFATKGQLEYETKRAMDAEKANAGDIAMVKADVATNTNDIAQLKKDVTSLEPSVENTDTVKMTVSKGTNGTTLSSEVKLDMEKANILQFSGNGLYAEVTLDYNTAENKLKFIAAGVEKVIQLNSATIVQTGKYDSTTREIVLTLTDGSEIKIPVSDLFNQLKAINPDNDPVNLEIHNNADGQDTIQATLNISGDPDNLINTNNGTLFASNQAKRHFMNLDGVNPNTDVETAVNTVNNTAKEAKAGVDALNTQVAALNTDVAALKSDMADAKSNITSLQSQLTVVDGKFDTQNGKISALEGTVNNLSTTVDGLNTRLTAAEGKITDYGYKIEQLRTDVDDLKNKVLGVTGADGILTRLAKVEEFLENHLIDFGGYN